MRHTPLVTTAALLGLINLAYAVDPPENMHAAGAFADGSLAVHVTEAGLGSAGQLVSAVVPPGPILVDDIDESGISISNLKIYPTVQSAVLRPGNGVIDGDITLTVLINGPQDKFLLEYGSGWLGEECPGFVQQFPVNVTLPISLAVVPDAALGHNVYDVTFGQIGVINGLQNTHINLDCNIGTIDDVLSFFGLSLVQFVIDFANDYLVEFVEDELPALEADLEEALLAAYFDDVVDLQGVPLEITLEPNDASITPDGVDLGFRTRVFAPPADCIAEYDFGGSAYVDGPRPTLAQNPAGTEFVAHISDDFVNQALYGAWRGGLLCQELAEGEFAGLSIDTSLLGLIGGPAYEELLPEAKPMVLKTVPRSAPTVSWTGGNDVTLPLRDFDVEFFAELDGRVANVLGVTLTSDIGADVQFNAATGEMAVALDLTRGFNPAINGDKMVPVPAAELEAQVGGVLDGLVGSLLGSLLGESLAFSLGGIEVTEGGQAIGLTSLNISATGGQQDWGGFAATVGPVAYGAGGCEDGCSGGSGCDATRGRASLLGFAGLLVLLARRRRR